MDWRLCPVRDDAREAAQPHWDRRLDPMSCPDHRPASRQQKPPV